MHEIPEAPPITAVLKGVWPVTTCDLSTKAQWCTMAALLSLVWGGGGGGGGGGGSTVGIGVETNHAIDSDLLNKNRK